MVEYFRPHQGILWHVTKYESMWHECIPKIPFCSLELAHHSLLIVHQLTLLAKIVSQPHVPLLLFYNMGLNPLGSWSFRATTKYCPYMSTIKF